MKNSRLDLEKSAKTGIANETRKTETSAGQKFPS
jgi:hypothetical protein